MPLHHAPVPGLLLVLDFITHTPCSAVLSVAVMAPWVPQSPRVPGRFLRDHPRKQSRATVGEGSGGPISASAGVTLCFVCHPFIFCVRLFLQQFVRKDFKHTGKVKEGCSELLEPHHLETTST